MHSKRTGVPMMASCQLDEPRVITVYKLQADRKALGVTFKADQKKVLCRCYLLAYNISFCMSNFDRWSTLFRSQIWFLYTKWDLGSLSFPLVGCDYDKVDTVCDFTSKL